MRVYSVVMMKKLRRNAGVMAHHPRIILCGVLTVLPCSGAQGGP